LESLVISELEILSAFKKTRSQTKFLCETLEIEDFVVQPIVDVSPLKWHLGHTTWFFENFVLVPEMKDYQPFHPKFNYLFNSYYVAAGERWTRANRGQLTRPTVKEIFRYRAFVEEHMEMFVAENSLSQALLKVIELGINHEQQHQELFLYDIKRILGDNPLNPVFRTSKETQEIAKGKEWLKIEEGVYEIGHAGEAFHFDNEKGRHNVFLHEFEIESGLVTNSEYLEFINDGGYKSFQFWLHEAWDWVNTNEIGSPRYWAIEDGEWWHYTLGGYEKVNLNDPLSHVSYYEADAFARWKGCRLPTEQEWEVACKKFNPEISDSSNFFESNYFKPIQSDEYGFLGNLWEWTSSAYGAYPFFDIAEGALGEYNGKFMVNQMVLRGGSFGTPSNHIRPTYRNFFHPHLRWLFSGIRLAKHTI
jgi:ergothioneine biosynthesis protein EgtB